MTGLTSLVCTVMEISSNHCLIVKGCDTKLCIDTVSDASKRINFKNSLLKSI